MWPSSTAKATLRQTVTLPPLDGPFGYAQDRRTVLELHNLRAAVAHVHVNGQQVGTLRNLLGPHHLTGGDLAWTGPKEFRNKNCWIDDYILVPFGF